MILCAHGRLCAQTDERRKESRMTTDSSPSFEIVRREAPAILGKPGKPVTKVFGGPFFFGLEIDGAGAEVLVVDGHVLPKGLKSIAAYLRASRFLETRTMRFNDVWMALARYGEFPSGFDPMKSQHAGGPSLNYLQDHAVFTVFAHEAPPQPTTPTINLALGRRPQGASRPRMRRAILRIDASYDLKWKVDRSREGTTDVWDPL
jgi:hypothetical protein